MTEAELRKKVAQTAEKFIGTIQGSVKHKDLVDIYNSYTPQPRGHKLTYTEPWCAGFVSAIAIQCGIADIMPVECSCGQMIELYKKLGRWVENDKHVPNVGDVIFYAWDDDKKTYKTTDNTTGHDHVGIVTEVNGNSFFVTEGNRKISGVFQVAYMAMEVNGRYIRGYGVPDFASKKEKPWYEDAMTWTKEIGVMDGTRPLDNVTRAELATVAKRLYDLLS